MGVIEGVLTGLIVAAITGGTGYVIGKRKKEEEFKRKYKSAVRAYAEELRKLIKTANPKDASRNVVIRARSIVAVRNSLRRSLTTLTDLLNSNIDRLEELVGGDDRDVSQVGPVRDRLTVLMESWPSKEAEIEVALRRILAELGMVEKGE